MGLSKKLRKVVEEVVRRYTGEQIDSLCETLGAHLQRIESLEKKVYGPMIQRLENRVHQPSPDPLVAVGTIEHEGLHSQIDRLARFILDEVQVEPSQNEGAVDTAIRVIRSYQSEQEAEAESYGKWSPTILSRLMPKAREDADKLPNEVRVRLFDAKLYGPNHHMDLTMLVRKIDDSEFVIGYGVPIMSVQTAGGSMNVAVPSDSPTAMMVELLRHLQSQEPEAWKRVGNTVFYKAQFFDRPDWLPEHATVDFMTDSMPSAPWMHPSHGVSLADLVELYGEHAAEICLIGQSFVQAAIRPLKEEAPTPPADPPPPSPTP